MRLINRNTDYAIRALLFFAREDNTLVSVSRLAEELGIPYPFLRRILLSLKRAGYLDSTKGREGGFRLIKDPAEIRVVDLIRVFQGEVKLTECFLQKNICPDTESCPLRKKIKELEEIMVSRLSSLTLQELLDGEERS